MVKNNKYLWTVGLFLVALIFRFSLLNYTYVQVVEADGAGYINDAKAFLDSFDLSKINIINHPLFPILIALFSCFTSEWEMAGRMVGITFGSLMAPLLFLISREKGNTLDVSVAAGLLISVTPVFVTSSYQVFNDALNCSLLLLGIWQVLVALKKEKVKSFFFSGFAFGLAYLTRPDSIVPSFFVFVLVAYPLARARFSKEGWTRFGFFSIGIAILAIPYVLFLHVQLGQWVVSGRQGPVKASLSAFTGGNYEDDHYGLTKDLTLRGEVLRKVENVSESAEKGLVGMWLEKPDEMFKSLKNNFKSEREQFLSFVPWYIAVLFLLNVIVKRGRFITSNLPLFAFMSPLIFLYPFFYADARHTIPFLIPFWLWAAEGVESLAGVVQKTKVGEKIFYRASRQEFFKYFLYLVMMAVPVFSFKPKSIGPQQQFYLQQKELGTWISKNTPEDSVIMSRWSRLMFYTDRKTVMFPYASWDKIKRYMKKNGVTHLVVDESFFGIRPQVRHLLTPLVTGSLQSPDKSLSIIKLKRDRAGSMVVYEVVGD